MLIYALAAVVILLLIILFRYLPKRIFFLFVAPRSGRDCFSDEQGTARTGSLDTGTACRH